MTSLPRTAIGMTLVACLGLTSCGDKKVATKHRAGDPLFAEPLFAAAREKGKQFTPEQEAFFQACAKLKVGMSEQEVDAIMDGYPSQWLKLQGEDTEPAIKFYDDKRDAKEYDYNLQVHFDANHLVVKGYVMDIAIGFLHS